MKTKMLVIAGSALVVLSGCDRSSDPGMSLQQGTSVGQLTDSARDSAVTAYRAMWNVFADVGVASDPNSPLLGRHANGAALDKLKRSLQSDRENGFVSKGKPLLDPMVSAAEPHDDPKKITITDCGDSTNWLKHHKDSGLHADNALGGRRLIKAVVDKQPDGVWKVSDYAVHEIGSC
ncbi:hypothetical protein [Lentzea cavernae]|uniref:Lipoprotein n=1 Tax=Lentzea cavernae TaxID=2020703 RepID=A0ABQ3MWB1_9PSEU|nr:hypothetical protein [Lentzea cavernae]GHH62486.1 hypothetical protein GCM10017774_90370 [Lentzea cavernae]